MTALRRITESDAADDRLIRDIVRVTPFQSRGIGAVLLDLAKQANSSLQLWAFEVNVRAIRFYERRGFRIVERTDGAGNEAKQPDVRMRWDDAGIDYANKQGPPE